MAKPLYLLDTNILVHACRRDSAWEVIKAQEKGDKAPKGWLTQLWLLKNV